MMAALDQLKHFWDVYLTHYPAFIDQPLVWVGGGVLGLLAAAWLFALMVRGIGVFLGGTYVPVQEAIDQGTLLEAQMQGTSVWLTKTLADLSLDIQKEIQTNITAYVEQLTADLMKEQAGVRAVFQRPTPALALRTFIGEEEIRVGELVLVVHRRVSRFSRRTNSAGQFQDRLAGSVAAIVRVAEPRFLLVHTQENLKFEDGDSATIKTAKLLRRGHRWVERRLAWLSRPLSLRKNAWPVRARTVPWKLVLRARLGKDLPLSVRQGLLRINGIFYKVQEILRETARVVQFNLESASEELKEDAQGTIPPAALASARATAEGGMDRVVSRLKALLEELTQENKRIEEDLVSQAEIVLQRIRKDIDVADTVGAIVTAKMENAVFAGKERWARARKRTRIVVLKTRRRWKKIRSKLSQARAHLGLKRVDTQLCLDSLDGATVSQPLKKVPPLYRRVFRFDPLADDDFFVSRDQSLQLLESARDRWQLGFASSVGIYGSAGSGKTSLILCGQQRFFSGAKVYFLTLQDSLGDVPALIRFLSDSFQLEDLPLDASPAVLANTLKTKTGKAVVVLEGANLLFSRRVGGFEVLDAFIHLMSSTRPDLLWIVSMSESAWHYLDRVRSLSRHFAYTINTRNMDREDLERVMTVRHEITGYDLMFVAPEGFVPKKAALGKNITQEEAAQTAIRNRFFQDLKDASDGNTYTALYYWLTAVEFLDDKQVLVHPLKPLDTGAIRMLSPLHRLALVATLQHGVMTPLLYSRVFRAGISAGEILLRELRDKKLLFEDTPGRFVPNPILVPAVLKVLREGNLVYD